MELELKRFEEDDYYDIQDFNDNFESVESFVNERVHHIEGVVNTLIDKIDNFENFAFVTGVMSANGAMNLGWKPKVVFVFGTRITAAQGGTNDTVWSAGASIAMAFEGHLQRNHGANSTSNIVLEITASGFTTNALNGAAFSTTPATNASNPLKYVAFR